VTWLHECLMEDARRFCVYIGGSCVGYVVVPLRDLNKLSEWFYHPVVDISYRTIELN